MKVIDLLNKKVNGEDMPNKIMCKGILYLFDDKDTNWYIDENGYSYLESDYKHIYGEVEILEEEKKIPEKLGDFDLTTSSKLDLDLGLELNYGGVSDTFNDVYHKINEIIDYLKSKEGE